LRIGRPGRPRSARSLSRRAGARREVRSAPAAPRFLQVSTDLIGLRLRRSRGETHRTIADRGRARPLLRGQGRRRAATFAPTSSPTGLDAVVTRGSEHLWPVPSPRELIPYCFNHQCHDDQQAAALRRRPSTPRLGCMSATTPGPSATLLAHGRAGETYNIPGGNERANREVVARLLRAARQALVARPTGRGPAWHDRRYAMDGSRLAAPGLEERDALREGLWQRRPVVHPQ